MKLPKAVRERFRAHGRAGGLKRAASLTPEARTTVARKAAIRRWIRVRFGVSSLADLGLPGGELIDSGLDALAAGEESVEGLVVALAAPRLRREGLPLPVTVTQDAERRLYQLLERSSGDLAHARYLAYLRQVASFADSCSRARKT